MATYKEPSPADHCYAKLIEMFGDTMDMELICEVGNSSKWDFSQCVEALLMRSDTQALKRGKSSSTSSHTQDTPPPPMSYSQRFQSGLNATNAFQSSSRATLELPDKKNTHLDKLYYQISDGYKILVLMRGLPGSGKSTLARQLLQKAGLMDAAQHVISADNYFLDQRGNYNFDRSRLSDAHRDCQNRAKSMMIRNFAPIIVDNTNICLWEMEAYCVNAVDHGYIVHILEPTTSWAKNPDECHKRNSHNVPFDSILNMKRSYERIQNGQELLDHFHLPKRIHFQFRECPPIVKSPEIEAEPDVIKSFSPIQSCSDDIVVESEEIVQPNPFENFNWSAHERDVSLFWKENNLGKESEEAAISKLNSLPKPQPRTGTAGDDKSLCNQLLSALKQDMAPSGAPPKRERDVATDPESAVKKHRVGCPNENEAFADVRLAFPTYSIQFLWDLFEKCRGDANWMMNILLNENADVDNIPSGAEDEDFHCNCEPYASAADAPTPAAEDISIPGCSTAQRRPPPVKAAPPTHRPKKKTTFHQRTYDPEAEQMKRQIEESVQIRDEFYTANMKRVREWKKGSNKKRTNATGTEPPFGLAEDTERSSASGTGGDDDDDYDEAEGEDVFEFRLGSEFINQLEGLFNTNSDGLDFHKFRPNVFMKKSLAKQIYHLWVESMMYQLEEQKLDALKDDEEIARQINELDEMKRSAVKFSDVAQMADAMHAYVGNNDWANGGLHLALKLKQQKLYEVFPSVDRSTIDELLQENEDNYERVVDTLNIAYQQNGDERIIEQKNKLILEAKIESDKIPQQPVTIVNKPLSTGDAKRDALREFEENRNKAMHHHQLRQECHQKAREAGQKRNSEVAYYFLQIAKLHNYKFDHYNHLAANSIVNVHDLTHNNNELIDLHYLLVQEAIPCLEVFLDSHIIRLRRNKLPYKQIFIITGRGLHSVSGIPTIKVNVKNYLAKRGLRCIEVNPGLLRVKLYYNCRTTEQ